MNILKHWWIIPISFIVVFCLRPYIRRRVHTFKSFVFNGYGSTENHGEELIPWTLQIHPTDEIRWGRNRFEMKFNSSSDAEKYIRQHYLWIFAQQIDTQLKMILSNPEQNECLEYKPFKIFKTWLKHTCI